MRLLAIAPAAAILAATPAQAAPPWRAASDVSTTEQVGAPRVAFDADGRSLLAFEFRDGVESFTEILTASGRLQLDGAPTGLVRSGARSFLLTRRSVQRVHLTHLTGRGAAIGWRVTAHAADHALASNLRGRSAVAWIDGRRAGTAAVRVRLAGERGRPGRRITLGRADGITDVDVAVGPRGQVAVLWSEDRGSRRRVVARVRDRGGRRFGRVLRLGRHAGLARIDAAYLSSGRLAAVYWSQDPGEEASRPPEVRWASVGRSARRVSARGLLDAGSVAERPQGDVHVRATPEGAVTLYAVPVAPDRSEIRTAASGRSGRFGAPEVLAPEGVWGDLAEGASGALLATWARREGSAAMAVWAAAGSPGGAFGLPEEVAREEVAGAPSAAFSPATGRPTAVWIGREGPQAPFRVRAAERTG